MSTEPIPAITISTPMPAPEWARLERELFAVLDRAAIEFADRYTRPDGTLIWRDRWPGMDGSDDPYEAFHDLPMLYLLGGGERLLELARRQWDAVTWQWTEYGQVYREFDAYYDWMHHGESSKLFYLLGMADPASLQARTRAIRFADFYTGRDPAAPNYDPQLRMMRSPLNGSRGPRLQVTAEDWSTHQSELAKYPPPFDDLPGVTGPLCPWTDDAVFGHILERMNARMTRGDVPLNLTATSMAVHAYALTGDEAFRTWALDYTRAWAQRAADNGGLVPDNIGPTGKIGENYDGRWWGGYYGYQWPHGAATVLEPCAVAATNAALLSGDPTSLDLVRGLLDRLWQLGRERDGAWVTPARHTDAGWSDYRPPDVRVPIVAWFAGLTEADADRVSRIAGSADWGSPQPLRVKGNGAGNSQHWFAYLHGRTPDYPRQILAVDRERMQARQRDIAEDAGDPAEWDVHHWQDKSPLFTEGLLQTMWGAPMHIYHGGLPLASVRYFDPCARRPGLPADVAALVEEVTADAVTVTLVNCAGSPAQADDRDVVVQAGAFAEHDIVSAEPLDGTAGDPARVQVGGPWLPVRLSGGGRLRLRLRLHRLVRPPSYQPPWPAERAPLPLIQPRFQPRPAAG
jgi:hypothetical protein